MKFGLFCASVMYMYIIEAQKSGPYGLLGKFFAETYKKALTLVNFGRIVYTSTRYRV